MLTLLIVVISFLFALAMSFVISEIMSGTFAEYRERYGRRPSADCDPEQH